MQTFWGILTLFSGSKSGDFCGWLFLAWLPSMRPHHTSESFILGAKDRQEH